MNHPLLRDLASVAQSAHHEQRIGACNERSSGPDLLTMMRALQAKAGAGAVSFLRQHKEAKMRELFEMEHDKVSGGEDVPVLYPPMQSQDDIEQILDQLHHINDRPGTY